MDLILEFSNDELLEIIQKDPVLHSLQNGNDYIGIHRIVVYDKSIDEYCEFNICIVVKDGKPVDYYYDEVLPSDVEQTEGSDEYEAYQESLKEVYRGL